MTEFWEKSFQENQLMWGENPTDSVYEAIELFQKNGLKKILIPGFGYGRNAQVFTENGFDVSGIEISKTAIDLAKQHYKGNYKLFEGSVNDMPFDTELYDGIYCYALLHLLSEAERAKFIQNCFRQLKMGGVMVFITLSTKDARFGKGEELARNTFLTKHGLNLFFYDAHSIQKDLKDCGLFEMEELNEPKISVNDRSEFFWKIVCRKP